MATSKDIPTYHQTIDFESLMREARKHITELAGELWTDHNPSDPGITQLEVLAFCIADLSYRTSFEVKDLIEGYKGGLAQAHDLPLMNVALPNHPVTIKDLRKVLIDLVHPNFKLTEHLPEIDQYETKLLVRNAFPTITDKAEVDFYSASKSGRDTFLTFETDYEGSFTETYQESSGLLKSTSHQKKADTLGGKQVIPSNESKPIQNLESLNATLDVENLLTPFDPKIKSKFEFLDLIQLNGLYKIQIEFEEDIHYNNQEQKHLRDLNQNFFQASITSNSKLYEISVLMPYWDDVIWSMKDLNLTHPQTEVHFVNRFQYDYYIAVDKLNYDDYFYDYYAEVLLGGYKLPLYVKVHFLDQLNEIKQGIPDSISVNGKTLTFRANFLDWNELANGVNQNYNSGGNHQLSPNLQSLPTEWNVETNAVGIEGELPTFDIQAGFSFLKETISDNGNGSFTYSYDRQKKIKLLTRITFDEGVIVKDSDINQIEVALSEKFPDLFLQKIELEKAIKSKINDVQATFYKKYLEKLNRVFDHLYGSHGIWPYLGKYRNLCEDFAEFSASRVQEIALFGKIKVATGYNINELLAEIYFRIDQFLSPLVKFNTLSEMSVKGYRFEEIFNGPLLAHGFIENTDLDNLKRRSVVYTSDLIRIIMNVEGVLFVENFSISGYIDNRLMGRNVLNCLSLTNSEIYKPQFGYDKTKLEIWVDDELGDFDKSSVKSWFDQKKSRQKNEQLPSITQLSGDQTLTSIPSGVDMEVEKYYSIQHDFPEVYGIGEYGLPLDADDERKSRAKQLKAFLLPFEQLLANYLKQVAHLPELFSFNRAIERTYNYQPLYNVPDVQPLFAEISEDPNAWQTFKADLDNVYMTQVKAGESNAEFLNRRNRFLNHLLARFGESFEAYSRQMFDRHKTLLNDPLNGISNFRAAQTATLQKLIQDKISFAEDFPKVSSQRYKSFDTTVQHPVSLSWHDLNIESYKLRLCRLLGIENVANESIFMTTQTPHGNWLDSEGMHVVEHILLRPRRANAQLLTLKNEILPNSQGTFIYNSEKDPYSFRVTIVLPKEAGRFVDKSFRQFTERLIRFETPAHIRVDFNWMSGQCGKNFEKHYSLWKQNIYQLKPWLFQGRPSETKVDPTISVSDTPVKQPISPDNLSAISRTKKPARTDLNPTEIKPELNLIDRPSGQTKSSIFILQDNLVKALQTPCKLQLSAYDDNHRLFNATNGVIRFEHLTTDVFNLKVNELGGVITCYKIDKSINDWKEVAKFNPIKKTYFNINDFLRSDHGLTSNIGNCGFFKIEYALDQQDSVEILIEVSRAKTKPSIVIKDIQKDTILSFDSETDGAFKTSNLTWDGFSLIFYPDFPQNSCVTKPENLMNEQGGIISISSPNKGLQPTVIDPGKSQNGMYTVSIKDLYAKFGSGKYHLVYRLDGLSTFIDLDLFVELSITLFNGKIKLEPDSDGIIRIPSAVKKIDLYVNLPSGELKVFDLDGQVQNENNLLDGDRFNPFGTVAYFKKADHIQINRDKDPVYINGHHYRFLYEFLGETAEVVLLFESPKLELPTLKLFADESEMTAEPFVLMIGKKPINYALEFHPKDANVEAWIVQEDGSIRIIESLTVTTDFQIERLEVGEMYRNYGTVPIFISCTNANGSKQLSFTLKLENEPLAPTNVIVKNTTTNKEVTANAAVYDLIYDHKNQKQEFELNFNNGNGVLQITDEKAKIYEVAVPQNSIQFDGSSPIAKGLATGVYKCLYKPKEGVELKFTLNVINLRPIFELRDITETKSIFQATAIPLFPTAQSYIWRLNGKYISRAKNPKITFDFEKVDKYIVDLTMHLSENSATEAMEITTQILKSR